jgi:hypothetical protein
MLNNPELLSARLDTAQLSYHGSFATGNFIGLTAVAIKRASC